MMKNKKCTGFELDENTNRCKYYGGSLKHLAACYDECTKREKIQTKKDKLKAELEKCYVGAIIE